MKTKLRSLLAVALLASSATFVHAQTLLVSETFGGGAVNLNGLTATTFSPAITSAGGSDTWRAPTAGTILANGSITASTPGSAYLNLGSYINSARGTADGIFTISATVGKPTGASGSWVGVGFFQNTAADNSLSGSTFVDAGLTGYAYALSRRGTDTASNFFAGPVSNNAFDPGNISTSVTFKIELDLRSYNGTSNWGTVRFYNPADLNSVSWTYTYTSGNAPASIQGIGFSFGSAGSVGNLTLTQGVAVPEPGTYAILAGVVMLGFVTLRRRRGV